MGRFSKEQIMRRMAITCPQGWKPSSTGKTCTDGDGQYRLPGDDSTGENKPELPEAKAKKEVHNRLEQHFKGKSPETMRDGLKKLLDKAQKSLSETKDVNNKQVYRQMQEGIIVFGEKNGIKLSSVSDRVAAAYDEQIAGALFDFMGRLTTLDEPVTLSGRHDAGVIIPIAEAWAGERGLSLDEADVSGWNADSSIEEVAGELVRVAKLLIAGSPLDGMNKTKAVKVVNKLIDKHTHGFFSDDYWLPVKNIFKDMVEAGIEGVVTKTEYIKNEAGVPIRKEWKFEIEFINNTGKQTVLYGNITASGAGSEKDPLDRYDVTAYVG
jgi:hypothetical protein